ncbi:cryptochrome/photolyase family protein [Actinocrispum wychmicini]|uniref:Deoxyribodipyrimidine photo-lyase n=1 Tax=Actinocrispum wychmicini TaxID=1213861 RepID=A0A4V6NP10_9PSEU|nr:deoxyribodipyrimidine photo-lyase [Actinocrispum wychmicini]TCO62520.1 deoxyribodipyrimidine photo-lyase [Actinocrispum wychmicini]
MTTTIALFTRDLRVHDNPVLTGAVGAGGFVVPLFVWDSAVTAAGFGAEPRARFLAGCLADLDERLRARGGALVERHGDLVTEVCRLAEQVDATEVHVASDVSAFATNRARRLADALAAQRRQLVCHDGVHTVVAPGAITPHGRDHFAVFTPYHHKWAAAPRRAVLPPPRRLQMPPDLDASIQRDDKAGGETPSRRKARSWLSDGLDAYHERHDDLAGDATSRLSPYLHFGCVSAVELAAEAADRRTEGGDAFVRQLAWRDFHHQVLAARPDAAHSDYRPRGDRWRQDEQALQAWQHGQTGIPIVDAGMRQLLAEGWMHNRARMITGSFLTKTLYLDWRAGAAHFLRHLIDGDLANNNLNWQWVAGTGTDTRPNRVLNPLRQAERFDPSGDYTRRWVPELAGLDDPRRPWRLGAEALRRLGYPAPIVDLDAARDRFREARQLALEL